MEDGTLSGMCAGSGSFFLFAAIKRWEVFYVHVHTTLTHRFTNKLLYLILELQNITCRDHRSHYLLMETLRYLRVDQYEMHEFTNFFHGKNVRLVIIKL